MTGLTSLIRADSEFKKYLSTFRQTVGADEPLPIAVNGLSGGAESAFVAESIVEARRVCGAPVLVLVENEGERERLTRALNEAGITAMQYKRRDFVFHNIYTSKNKIWLFFNFF